MDADTVDSKVTLRFGVERKFFGKISRFHASYNIVDINLSILFWNTSTLLSFFTSFLIWVCLFSTNTSHYS